MLRFSLEKKFNCIDTTNIIDNSNYIDNSDEVKETISCRARAWTRTRRFHDSEGFWKSEYKPKQYVPPNAFGEVINTITLDELMAAIKEALNNKAAGPSSLTYKCWKHASDLVLNALLVMFERTILHKKMPKN